MLNCPQCGQAADFGRLRLVQDSCGHRKCRECLLSDEASCWSCSSPVYTDLQPASSAAPPLSSPSANNDDQLPSRNNCMNDTTDSFRSQEASNPLSGGETEVDGSTLSQAEDDSPLETDSGITVKSTNDKGKDKIVNDSKCKKRQHLGLKEHIVFTPGDPPMYHCKICRKSYNNRKAARYHNYCGLPDTFKPHRCEVCGQGFVTTGHYSYHMKSHSGSLPFLCEICDKGFKQSSKLKRHMKSHEGEKPFKCDICSRFFSAKHVLKDHMMLHSGNHILSCPVCSKKFSSKSCLRKHRLLHSDPSHKCDYCGKKFPVKWNLEMHRKTHLRERRHKCKQCNRAFKILSDLKRHASVHREDGEWVCELCKIVFRRKDNLVRHLKNIHPETQINGTNPANRNKELASSGDTSTAKITLPPASQAVSVIRGRAVPVIQKMGGLPCQGSEETTGFRSERTSLSNCVNEDSCIGVNDHPESTDTLCSSTVSELPSCSNDESKESQPSGLKDQKFLRESVVCHSGARGIVHFGSAAYESDWVVISSEERTEVSDNLQEAYSSIASKSTEVALDEYSSNNSLIYRPKVIVEKVHL